MTSWESLKELGDDLPVGDDLPGRYEIGLTANITGVGDGRVAVPTWHITIHGAGDDEPVKLRISPSRLIDSLDYDHDDPDECECYHEEKLKEKEKIIQALASLGEGETAIYDPGTLIMVNNHKNTTKIACHRGDEYGEVSTFTTKIGSAEVGRQLLRSMANVLEYVWA